MSFRSDISVDWAASPRLVRVAAPSQEVIIQDLHDTLRVLEYRPGEGFAYPKIIDTFGKQALGGGVLVGLTAVLYNARLLFEARRASIETGTITTPDTLGITLTDATATFLGSGVQPGAWVVNMTDGSVASVTRVVSETELVTDGLGDGSDNQFNTSDVYEVRNVIQCDVTGGNLVAVDTVGDPISSILPTAGTQVAKTASSSATLQELQDIQYSSFDNQVSVDTTSTYSGTAYPVGTSRQPVNNIADPLAIAAVRGFTTLHVLKDVALSTGTFTDLRIEAVRRDVRVTVNAGANVSGCQFHNLTVTGTLDGDVEIRDCLIEDLTYVDGTVQDCALRGTITLSGAQDTSIVNCWDDISGVGTPTIDFGGAGSSLIVREYRGGLVLRNKSGPEEVSLNLEGGRVVCEATYNGSGSTIVHGVGVITSSGTAPIDDSRLLNPFLAIQTTVSAGSTNAQVHTSLTAPDGYYDGMLLEVQHGGSAYVRGIDRYRNMNGAMYLGKNLPFTPVAGARVRILLNFYLATRGRAG